MNCNFAHGHSGYCPHEKERDNRVKLSDEDGAIWVDDGY